MIKQTGHKNKEENSIATSLATEHFLYISLISATRPLLIDQMPTRWTNQQEFLYKRSQSKTSSKESMRALVSCKFVTTTSSHPFST